jgi:hypothetical protein
MAAGPDVEGSVKLTSAKRGSIGGMEKISTAILHVISYSKQTNPALLT